MGYFDLSRPYIRCFSQWVEAGGGVVGTGWLVFAAGAATGPDIPDINAIIPVDTSTTHQYFYNGTVSVTAVDHPITEGVVSFAVGDSYVEASGGATEVGVTVLATTGNVPTVVADEVGSGRGVYLGPVYMYPYLGNLTTPGGDGDRLFEQAVAWAATGDHRDSYLIDVAEGATIEIGTQTPGDDSGEPVNGLGPYLELYNPLGFLVAQNDNGGADGRNARIAYTVPSESGGTYEVRVRAATGTAASARMFERHDELNHVRINV